MVSYILVSRTTFVNILIVKTVKPVKIIPSISKNPDPTGFEKTLSAFREILYRLLMREQHEKFILHDQNSNFFNFGSVCDLII